MSHSVFILGCSIFSMFFGSGNLVFPLQIGKECLNNWWVGFLGLFISAIIIPFAGVFVIKRYKGIYQNFFKELGFKAEIIIPFILLSLLGSFGIVPRCITVAFGGFHVLAPDLPLWIFGLIFSVICFFVGLQNTRMLNVIGKFMTPIKLGTLVLIIVMGVVHAPQMQIDSKPVLDAFGFGLVQGYQTMDLIAGFFFSALIFQHIEQQCVKGTPLKTIFVISAKASLVGASIIAVAYAGLVYLGAKYVDVLHNVYPTEILPMLTKYLLGDYAIVVIALSMGFSCLATAIALNNLYADFLGKLFKVKQEYFVYILLATTAIAFAISLLDFQEIAILLIPILKILYPGLIVFTCFSLFYPKRHMLKNIAFYGVTFLTIIYLYWL